MERLGISALATRPERGRGWTADMKFGYPADLIVLDAQSGPVQQLRTEGLRALRVDAAAQTRRAIIEQ